MADGRRPSRRDFLRTAGAAVAITPLGSAAVEDEPPGEFLLKSQPKPEPRVILPTDALPKPDGPRKRIAAVTTAYFRYSHADDIITKFIEGYAVAERTHMPHCEVVSLAIEQFPERDIGRGLAACYRIPLFGSPAGALTLGGPRLAVDGVLLIGEHGDYPINTKGQQLYPRRRLFAEIVETFRRSGRSVPVYNDKHFSYSWADAEWMYRQSRELGFPMMAGSSVPVAWRRPPLAFRTGIPLDGALAVGFGGIESYGFHTLELLQAFVERRRDTVTGVAAVACLEGKAAWEAAEQGLWRADLLPAALRHVPGAESLPNDVAACRRADPQAAVFLVEYADGFRAAAYMARRLVAEFAFAARVAGRNEPVGTWCELNKPQRDHFSFLCNHIEVMFRTGRPSNPVERTYLVTGVLAALMDSRAQGGLRVETPHLRDIRYDPAPEWTAS
jgi:hypothetical protein